MVDLGGYVIILVETNDKRVKLYGEKFFHINWPFFIFNNWEIKIKCQTPEFWYETNFIFNFSVGSPADKADLEVADEILEINGKALHNCSHTEVIAHIHNVSHNFGQKHYRNI